MYNISEMWSTWGINWFISRASQIVDFYHNRVSLPVDTSYSKGSPAVLDRIEGDHSSAYSPLRWLRSLEVRERPPLTVARGGFKCSDSGRSRDESCHKTPSDVERKQMSGTGS